MEVPNSEVTQQPGIHFEIGGGWSYTQLRNHFLTMYCLHIGLFPPRALISFKRRNLSLCPCVSTSAPCSSVKDSQGMPIKWQKLELCTESAYQDELGLIVTSFESQHIRDEKTLRGYLVHCPELSAIGNVLYQYCPIQQPLVVGSYGVLQCAYWK